MERIDLGVFDVSGEPVTTSSLKWPAVEKNELLATVKSHNVRIPGIGSLYPGKTVRLVTQTHRRGMSIVCEEFVYSNGKLIEYTNLDARV